MSMSLPVLAAFVLLMPGTSFAEGCDKPADLFSRTTPYSLHGICLAFSSISSGMRLPLGSIIFVPMQDRKPILGLSIDRASLSKRFIENLFDDPDDSVLASHPLAWRGIALTLTNSRLRLAIYSGVILHLRTDIPNIPSYRTFVGEPDFIVENVVGEAYVSQDLSTIADKFADVFVEYRVPSQEMSRALTANGNVRIVLSPIWEDALPPLLAPRQE